MQAGRLAGRQAGRQASRQVGRQAGRQANKQAGRQAGRRAGGQAGRQAGRQAGGRAGRHAGRQAVRLWRRQAVSYSGRQASRHAIGSQTIRQTVRAAPMQAFHQASLLCWMCVQPPIRLITISFWNDFKSFGITGSAHRQIRSSLMWMIHSSTTTAWLPMRKHYRDYDSVPLMQFVCVWRRTCFD